MNTWVYETENISRAGGIWTRGLLVPNQARSPCATTRRRILPDIPAKSKIYRQSFQESQGL